ncbi:MAG: excinuclease ABC subunit UvrA, partial [Nevskiaceae bacterium]|nr:excinuclease ABC subunit UvrA [Nevskiaceae bacterium]
MDQIRVRGARTHNLRNIDVDLPRNRLIVITGLSGSGKSSLAFDTLYAEGQRRYVESLSAYARQFLSMMDKPDVDSIEGLSPAIAIEQKATSHNPRSTVGTVTEIHDYLRLLYARAGIPRCPTHHIDLTAQTVSQMVDQVLTLPEGESCLLLAPLIAARKGEHHDIFADLASRGFVRVRVDGVVSEIDAVPALDAKRKHHIEAVVDRFKVRPDIAQRLAESFETALRLGNGFARLAFAAKGRDELTFSSVHACPLCGHSVPPLEPKLFSFNSPAGACSGCDGLGFQEFFDPQRIVMHPQLSLAGGAIRGWDRRNAYYFQMIRALAEHYDFDIEAPWSALPKNVRDVVLNGSGNTDIAFRYTDSRGRAARRAHPFEGIIPNLERRYRETESVTVREELGKYRGTRRCIECDGARLNADARHVHVGGDTLPQIAALSVADALQRYTQLRLDGWRGEIAARIVKEVADRLRFLVDVGLDYLTLERSAETLSGGESQRIRLASQVGSGLVGVLYILDEPSIGLHQRDNQRLLGTLQRLRDLGNTVLVVEHDEEAILRADHVLDLGPGAGVHGGRIVAQGTPKQICATPDSLTGRYLSGREAIATPARRHPRDPQRSIHIKGARANNLKTVSADFPIGLFTCVTGVSGSGKSTLVNNTLFAAACNHLGLVGHDPPQADAVTGLELIDRVIDIDQSPIGRTPRSNPATYT